MCGIAGIIAYHPNAPTVDRDELLRVRDAQANRGPDSNGAWFSKDQRSALGHNRLSIIDLSAHADQPMVSADNQYVIVFNGEIYNYRELRNTLIAAGVSFTTESDTEVLLKGYQHWGESLLNKIRGMYAFAIWDALNSRLMLARDPYGIKPLYYSLDGRTIRFASQVKALLKGQLHTLQPEAAGVVGFLMMGSVPEPYTTYRAIRALGAGQYLFVDQNGVAEPKSHYSVVATWRSADAAPVVADEEEMQHVIRHALCDSVQHHMTADVPVGAFLSAGIDSGALVGMMSETVREKIQTVSLGFEDFRGTHSDETVLAAEIAQIYGSQHETHWVTDAEVVEDLPRILEAMDQPSIDGINTWLVSKIAHQRGLKVVVSGVGGDELFGGYEHFSQLPKWRANHRRLHRLPGAAQLSYWLSKGLVRAGLVPAKAPAWVLYGKSYPGLYLARRGLFMPWEIPRLVGLDMAMAGLEELNPPGFIDAVMGPEPMGDFASIAGLESAFYLRNQLLRDSDWASMAHSLELRTPLVDVNLQKSLAPYLTIENHPLKGKLGLARSPRPVLPPAVVDRRKTGFSLPMARWLADSEILSDWRSFPSVAGSHCHWSRRMACALIAKNLACRL